MVKSWIDEINQDIVATSAFPLDVMVETEITQMSPAEYELGRFDNFSQAIKFATDNEERKYCLNVIVKETGDYLVFLSLRRFYDENGMAIEEAHVYSGERSLGRENVRGVSTGFLFDAENAYVRGLADTVSFRDDWSEGYDYAKAELAKGIPEGVNVYEHFRAATQKIKDALDKREGKGSGITIGTRFEPQAVVEKMTNVFLMAYSRFYRGEL